MKLFLLIASAAVCFAQPRGDVFFPWWDMPIARDLNLTEEQTKQIQSTVREARDRLIDLRGAVEKADNHLADAVNEDAPDTQRVTAAIDRVAAARAELTKAYSQMGFKLRLVLTAHQWHELQRRRPRPPAMMQPGQPGQPGPGRAPGPGQRRPQGPPPNQPDQPVEL